MSTSPAPVESHAAKPSTPNNHSPDLKVEEQAASELRVSFQLDDGRLVETVVSPKGFFGFWIQGNDQPVNAIQCGDTKIEPHYGLRKFWEEKVVRFPYFPENYGTTVQLLEEISQFVRRYADLPEDWLDIVCLYVLMTWVYDRFRAVPYLRFLGEPGTGKTRLLEVCSSISYKGTIVNGNITGPALFRTIDLVQGTMAVDEGDFKNSAEWSDITKILNTGYAVGMPVIRCNKNTFDPECFHTFGPKIISTRNRFEDEATETRCLTLETKEQKVSSHIRFQLPVEFDKQALSLRNKLLKWRFDNFHRIAAREDGLRDLFARSGQIGASLAGVVPDEQWMKKLVGFLRGIEESTDKESPKGMIKEVLSRMSGSSAKVGEVAELVNSERKELGLEPLTDKKVGGILRSLGYKPERKKQGYVFALSPVNVE